MEQKTGAVWITLKRVAQERLDRVHEIARQLPTGQDKALILLHLAHAKRSVGAPDADECRDEAALVSETAQGFWHRSGRFLSHNADLGLWWLLALVGTTFLQERVKRFAQGRLLSGAPTDKVAPGGPAPGGDLTPGLKPPAPGAPDDTATDEPPV